MSQTQSLVSYSNITYTGMVNTEVSAEQIYKARQGANKLSVIRTVSGLVTIPTGYALSTGVTRYLPVMVDSVYQSRLPVQSIVKGITYSFVGFTGPVNSTVPKFDSTLNATQFKSFTSTSGADGVTNYTAGSSVGAHLITGTNISLNYIDTPAVSTGRPVGSGDYIVVSLLSGANITTVSESIVKVTINYYCPQELM